jgi:hypothetical protein
MRREERHSCKSFKPVPDGGHPMVDGSPLSLIGFAMTFSGNTYAIFIQDAAGTRPAIQVSDCTWNVQHPKWFPPRNDGKTLLIAAVQAGPMDPFRIASFDVTRLLEGH